MSYVCKTAAICLAKAKGGSGGCYLKLLKKTHVTCIRTYGKQTYATQEEPVPTATTTVPLQSETNTEEVRFRDDVAVVFHRPTGQLVSMKSILDNPSLFKTSNEEDQKSQDSRVTTTATKMKLLNAVKQTDLDWSKQTIDVKKLPQYYMKLSKIRLTGLVVLTEIGGYAMAPAVFDPLIFVIAALGTGALSCAANATNQFFEVPFDSQMARTKNRILVKAILSPLHAATFAITCGTLGLTTLYFGVNGITACLGALNLALYTLVYTPMKRVSIANTWIGSIVGAIPPIMGWTACTGTLDAGGLLMGAILYAWQFPHFNALSWNLRGDYSRAGYRMMSVTDPELCRRTTLRYSIVMLGLCSLAPLVELTTWTFAFDSLPLNAYLIYLSYRFYKNAESSSSRKLFRFSLIHLPAIIILLLISKKHYGKRNPASDKRHEEQKDS